MQHGIHAADAGTETFDIRHVLSPPEFTKYHVAVHVPLRSILKDFSGLTREEAEYVRHSSTHVDFLIFDRIDKSPKLIIECLVLLFEQWIFRSFTI